MMRKLLVAFLLTLALLPQLATAQLRGLPQGGKPGILSSPDWPRIYIDGKSLRMAPGCVIWDQDNRTIVATSLPAEAAVWYTVDLQGDVSRIILLTVDEQAEIARARR